MLLIGHYGGAGESSEGFYGLGCRILWCRVYGLGFYHREVIVACRGGRGVAGKAIQGSGFGDQGQTGQGRGIRGRQSRGGYLRFRDQGQTGQGRLFRD